MASAIPWASTTRIPRRTPTGTTCQPRTAIPSPCGEPRGIGSAISLHVGNDGFTTFPGGAARGGKKAGSSCGTGTDIGSIDIGSTDVGAGRRSRRGGTTVGSTIAIVGAKAAGPVCGGGVGRRVGQSRGGSRSKG